MSNLPAEHRLDTAVYDGDTPRTQRLAIRQSLPRLVFTTPEMLHAGILPYHGGWRAFLQGLRYIVLPDIHRYNSALLSHMAHVLRRLQRVTQHYGARPQYMLTSAPLANMAEIAVVSRRKPVAWSLEQPGRPTLKAVFSWRALANLWRSVVSSCAAPGRRLTATRSRANKRFLARLASFHAEPSWAICPPP